MQQLLKVDEETQSRIKALENEVSYLKGIIKAIAEELGLDIDRDFGREREVEK